MKLVSDLFSTLPPPCHPSPAPPHVHTYFIVVNDGLLSAVQSLLNSLPMHTGQADSDDDENAAELDVGAMSGGQGLEDMTDYAHATLLRRCAIILRNISCDRYCRESAIALPWLMPMFQHLTNHLKAMARAPENFEQGQIAVSSSFVIFSLRTG